MGDGAFPGHPGRERRDFVERHVRVIADAALGRSERDVVLNAIAGEDFDLAVVHLHRTRDDNLPLGVGEDAPDAWLEIEDAGRAVELLQHRSEDRAVFGHALCILCKFEVRVRSGKWRWEGTKSRVSCGSRNTSPFELPTSNCRAADV